MKTIILLHGAIGSKDQLNLLSVELKHQSFKVYLFNFSGHGQTPFHANFGIEQFALELEEYIKVNQLENPMVFGYSMGGYVALYLAHQQPTLLGNIITLGTKFEWSQEIAQKEVKMLNSKTIIEKVPKFAESLKARHGKDWELLLQKTSRMMMDLGNRNTISLHDFASIENKVLIGIADKDNMVSLEETTAVYKQLKNSCMYMLPQTKHPIESIDVQFLSGIIHKFLNSSL